jgi:hypothetical protein
VPSWDTHPALPSAWVYKAKVDTDTLTAPGSWVNTAGAVSINTNFTDTHPTYALEILLDGVRVEVVPPNDDRSSVLFQGLSPSTSYVTSGRYIDPWGGTGTAATDTDSTSTTPSLSAPTNLNCVGYYPRTVVGNIAMEYELWVQAEESTDYLVAFEIARETAPGSGVYGSYGLETSTGPAYMTPVVWGLDENDARSISE